MNTVIFLMYVQEQHIFTSQLISDIGNAFGHLSPCCVILIETWVILRPFWAQSDRKKKKLVASIVQYIWKNMDCEESDLIKPFVVHKHDVKNVKNNRTKAGLS